jgi:hypothetical protein
VTTHIYFGLAENAVTLVIVGYAVLYALGVAHLGRGDVTLLGLAYLTGWGVLGIVLSYLLMAGIAVDLGSILVVAALLVLVSALIGRITPSLAPPARPARDGLLATAGFVVGAAVIVLALGAAAAIAVRSTWIPDYDAFSFWLPRANIIFFHHGLWLGNGGWWAFDHPEYPPLASTMYAVGYSFIGGNHPSLLSFQQILLGLSFVGAVLALLGRCVPRWVTFPALALLVVVPGFFNRLDSLLPDQTLAYFVALSVLTCLLWLRERRAAWLALTVILLVAGTLTKFEGETYACLLALIVCVGAVARRDRRRLLPALTLFLGVAAIEPWRIWLGDHALPTSDTDYHVSDLFHPEYLAHRAGRLPSALTGVLDALFKTSEWFVILPLALFVIVVTARYLPRVAVASAAWLILAFFGLVAVYWIGRFVPFNEADEIHTSAYRVSATIVVVAAVVAPFVLGLVLERSGGGGEERSQIGADRSSGRSAAV